MLHVTVALPSGRSEIFSILQSSKVGDLRVLAQKAFQLGFLRLVAADHSMVDPTKSLQDVGIEDGDHLTAIAVEAKLAATARAFALFCPGGDRVVTWGDPEYGADNPEVQDQLKGVWRIQATFGGAFAAILADGSVVTWGYPDFGGDSSKAQDQLKGVRQIESSDAVFAAILADGSVVTWGEPAEGGDSSEVQDQLKGVQQVQATYTAFAAILADGSVVTWGDPDFGGDSSEVQDQLKDVQQVQATNRAFAAIAADGSVVTWGNPDYGGDSSEVQDQLKDVQQVQASYHAFAAILANGSVVTWGNPDYGADSSEVQDRLKDVQQVQATYRAFAAILADGSVVTWGNSDYGGDSSEVQDQLKDVQQVQATYGAFAAILADGSVVTWANPILVVTALKSKISWEVSSRFKQPMVHLLQSWRMGRLWLGAIHCVVVTAQQFLISLHVCSQAAKSPFRSGSFGVLTRCPECVLKDLGSVQILCGIRMSTSNRARRHHAKMRSSFWVKDVNSNGYLTI